MHTSSATPCLAKQHIIFVLFRAKQSHQSFVLSHSELLRYLKNKVFARWAFLETHKREAVQPAVCGLCAIDERFMATDTNTGCAHRLRHEVTFDDRQCTLAFSMYSALNA